MGAMVPWARVFVVGSDGAVTASWLVGGRGRPDLRTVDALARSLLSARRRGSSLRLDEVCEELAQLLDLVDLGREMGGEPEGGEQVAGVEEGVEPGDPVA